MASNDLVESLESMIQCTICYEIMEEPKMLPCLHRFCLRCLKRSISALGPRKDFLCPLCRKPTPLPPGGPGSFKTDFMMSQMVDIVLKQKRKKVVQQEKRTNVLVNPTLLAIDSTIFPPNSWSVDDICSLPHVIVVVGSSRTLTYLLAFTVSGAMCFASDLSPKGIEMEKPFLSCVAAINDECVVVACVGRILIINIGSGRSEYEISKDIPNNKKPKSVAANSNMIVICVFSSQRLFEENSKRFQLFDHSLDFLMSVEVDGGNGIATSISLTNRYFYWIDHLAGNVYSVPLDDFTCETGVEKNVFCKPSIGKCTPLSMCCDSMNFIYVLWRVLGGTDVVKAGGRDCFDSCRKIAVQYSVEKPSEIVNQMDVDDKSHRISILDRNMETEKVLTVTKYNLFYACSEIRSSH